WNLRARRCFEPLKVAFAEGADRFGFRLVHYSVQGNHIHFVVEADTTESLSRGMQGLTVRMARKLNRVMGRKGKVFADRYHARMLKTLAEVKNALAYLRDNRKQHLAEHGERVSAQYRDVCVSVVAVVAPRAWLLARARGP